VVTILNFGLRFCMPGYQAAEPTMSFDLPMMVARLVESTIALIVAAILTARLSKGAPAAPWILAVVMLAVFIPFHYYLWPKFPVWYHLTFLSSLVVVPVIVGRAARPH
jgi:hypothetical protein